MNALIDWAITHRRTTLSIMVLLVLAGLFARSQIAVEADPRIEVPFFVVTIAHEGISPEDASRLLVMPMERELRTLEGVKEIKAYAAEGLATITIEFEPEADLAKARVDVREAVDRGKAEIPSTAEEPLVEEESTDDWPLLQINLTGNVPERMLYETARRLQHRIETVNGVLKVELRGQREEVLEAMIDPSLLEAYQLSVEQVLNNIVQNNRLIPAGSLETGNGRFAVKVPSVIETAGDLYDLPVKSDADSVVTLSQVAKIRRTFKDRTGYARVNGQPTISLAVIKRSNANVVATSHAVHDLVESLRGELPGQIQVFFSQDQAPWAEQQVRELEGNIFTALVLVMTLVVAALGVLSGVLVGIAIPVSFLFGLTVLYFAGFTFNIMVMFGMLLALGMLIDGSIVVTEYADRRMSEGDGRRTAYATAAKRMFWPVVASVATTLAAFLPLVFWPGVSGKYMAYLPATVFAVLVGSLVYALIFGPTLGAVLGRRPRRSARELAAMRIIEQGDPTELRTVTGLYARLLAVATRYSLLTLIATIGILYAAFALYGQFGRGVVYFSEGDPNMAIVEVKAQGNLSADRAAELVGEVEEIVLAIPGIKDLNTATSLPGGSRGGDVIGRLFIELHELSDRELSGNEIIERIRKRTAHLAGIEVQLRKMKWGPRVGKPISLEFSTRGSAQLEPVVRRVRDHMLNEMTGLRDVEDTLPPPGIEWTLHVDRAQAALYGANVTTVGRVVQFVTGGLKVGEYRPDDAEDAIDIRIRYPDTARAMAALDNLRVTTDRGPVPISNFVQRIATPRTDVIERVDGRRVEYLKADVAPGVLADNKVKELDAWLSRQHFAPGIDIRFRGAREEQEKANAFISAAFMLALLLMFILLVTQFNSFYQSALILFAVVMSTAGVLLGLVLTGKPFSVMLTGTGIVALAGIVVNNNIVLIDTYNHLRRESAHHSDYVGLIVRTGAQRLRPVVLTTATTILGLLPMASGYSIDFVNREVVYGGQISQMWVPLASAIVSGLTFATLLTLISTPAMLALPHQCRALAGKLRGMFGNRSHHADAA